MKHLGKHNPKKFDKYAWGVNQEFMEKEVIPDAKPPPKDRDETLYDDETGKLKKSEMHKKAVRELRRKEKLEKMTYAERSRYEKDITIK